MIVNKKCNYMVTVNGFIIAKRCSLEKALDLLIPLLKAEDIDRRIITLEYDEEH